MLNCNAILGDSSNKVDNSFGLIGINFRDKAFFFKLQEDGIIDKIVDVHFTRFRDLFSKVVECENKPITLGDMNSVENRTVGLITLRENFWVFSFKISSEHLE